MTALVHSVQTTLSLPQSDPARILRAAGLLALLAAVLAVPGAAGPSSEAALGAYSELAIFVAATLSLVLGVERLMGTDIGAGIARNPRWQVPLGAALGAFPGCGGAIVAVTYFTRGQVSFGALVATLIATGGDAVFLLLSAAPMSGLAVVGISFAVALPTGYLIDAVHGPDFMRPRPRVGERAAVAAGSARVRAQDRVWLALMIPAAVVGVPLSLANVEPTGALAAAIDAIAVVGVTLGAVMWIMDGDMDDCRGEAGEPQPLSKIAIGTNFVLAWSLFALVGYEVVSVAFGFRLEGLVSNAGWALPLIAIALAAIPGCGPQILVASLHVSGVLPFSAQIGNSIANDGDALFPAIAKAPKAALLATLYSAVPAVIVAYGFRLAGL